LNAIFSKFSFILIITYSGICLSGEKVSQSLSVDTTGTVFVEIPRGLVKIQGWDKQEVMIQGELDDTIKALTFKTKKDKTLIKVDTQGRRHWGNASLLKIFMPQQSQLHFKGIDTSFSIAKLSSHIQGKSITGDLLVKKSTGKIKLSVVSGNVKLVESSGFVQIESVSGTINFSGVFEKAFLKSMSGDITADISGMKKLTIKNISGDIQVSGQVEKKAQLKFTNVSGDIIYRVTDDLNAECEMVSQFGGEINNQLTDDLPIDSKSHKKMLSFISGDGSGKLFMKTITGSVTIEKSIDE
jgi:Toastrack DUF4097